MKAAPVLLLALLFFLSLGVTARAQTETASIKVVDQEGNPQAATTVILSTETVRKSFFTNTTGWAEFVGLSAETYNVSVLYSDVVIARDTVTVPEEATKTVTVFLADLSLKLLNLDGDPVAEKEVVLTSEGGNFTLTQKTDEDGGAVIQSLPYSSIETIGPYDLKVEYNGISVVDASVSVPVGELTLTAKLLNVRVTVTDLEGKPVTDASVLVKSTRTDLVSRTKLTSAGSAFFEELPSSSLPDVGDYRLLATVKRVVVFNQTRGFDESLNYSATASLGGLTLKVAEDSGDTISNVEVSISNQVNPEYGSYMTDRKGQVVLREVPLSTTAAGPYNLVFARGGVKVKDLNISLSLSQPFAEETVTIGRIRTEMAIEDFRGKPVANAAIELRDLSLPERTLRSTTSTEGLAVFEALPGAYRMTVRYRGREVLSRVVAMNQTRLEITGVAVDLPVTVVVVDSGGNPVPEAVAYATFNEEALFQGEVGRDGSFTVTVPYSGPLTVSVELAGILQAIETIHVDRPTTQHVSLQSILGFAGMRVSAGTLMAALTIVVIAVIVGLNVAARRKLLARKLKRIRRPQQTAPGKGKSEEKP